MPRRAQRLAFALFRSLGPRLRGGRNSSTSNTNYYLGRSGLAVDSNNAPDYQSARVYDTYSLHYEYDGINQTNTSATYADLGTNGADDNDAITGTAINGAHDPGEVETCPPYPVPLRGIQVKIRTMDPDSGQVREMTVVQEFLPQ